MSPTDQRLGPQDLAGQQVELRQVVQQQSVAVDARLQMELDIVAEDAAEGYGIGGQRDLVAARAITAPAALEARNPNNVGGDIAGGRCDQLRLVFRPTLAPVPYATPDPAIYLCSSATPPGPGVHGMCGYHAAGVVLRRVFGARAAAEVAA